jgi:hypothetical protein
MVVHACHPNYSRSEQKERPPSPKQPEPKGLEHGSSDKVPAQQVQSPEFKPSTAKRKKL